MASLKIWGSALLLGALPLPAFAESLLLISIDGLQPADVIEADKRGIKIPNLQRFVREGSYATGVIGVSPTVTYPSHATLLTGVSPAKHGIVSNNTFDPKQINQGGWYWFAQDYKVPTLWDAAAKKGMTVANVHWPVSVSAKSITWNLPQIWRTGHNDDAKLIDSLATPGLMAAMEKQLGPYAPGIDETIGGDENRGAFAVSLIGSKRPEFATVYLTALDHEQHQYGPNTPEAYAVMQRIDAIIGKLIAAQNAASPDSVIAIVSDHGFAKIDTEINLYRAFIDAELIVLDDAGKIKSWDAVPWNAGGSSAVVLAKPDDAALSAKVAQLLATLKADPKNRIAQIDDVAGIKKAGANPMAHFYVSFEPGAYAGGFKGKAAPLVGPSSSKGTHGYSPQNPLMRSSFMMIGKKIAKGRNLGVIDMRVIAPTLAKLMGANLPDAELAPLP